jgi:parvulin-like peptidyl-prolyl isomerase
MEFYLHLLAFRTGPHGANPSNCIDRIIDICWGGLRNAQIRANVLFFVNLSKTGLFMSVESQESPAVSFEDLARLGLLEPYIRSNLLALAASDVALSDEQIDAARQAFCRQHQIRDAEALKAWAVARMLSPAALEAQMRQSLQLQLLCQRNFSAKAEARFLQRKNQLDRVVYSLLRLRDGGLARELYLRIDDGDANFADLAARYAEGPEQATRGIVGPVPLTQAHPALVDRLRTAPPGVVLEPFQIESWWLVVRLESLTSATFDEATAARMAEELFEQWISEQVERRLVDLRPLLEKRVSADASQKTSLGSS